VAGPGPRRRVVTGVTLVVLAVVLCLMGYLGVKKALEPFPSGKSSANPTCTAHKEVQKFLTRKDVQVSVFNAGNRSGLASETLDRVEAAGFVAGNAGNAPGTAEVRRAVVWTTKPDDYSARLVALALGPGTQVVVTKTDLGPGVDVLVGNRFHGLDKSAAKRIKLPKPVETCVPVG
jgi:LytR cell envelope-related transcriptional attenuator